MMLHFHLPLIQLFNLLLLHQKATLNQNPILPPSSVCNLSKSHTALFLSFFLASCTILPEHMHFIPNP